MTSQGSILACIFSEASIRRDCMGGWAFMGCRQRRRFGQCPETPPTRLSPGLGINSDTVEMDAPWSHMQTMSIPGPYALPNDVLCYVRH